MASKPQFQTDTSIAVGERLIITVKEARKLLGKDFNHLGDEHIKDVITKLDLLAQGFIEEKVSI